MASTRTARVLPPNTATTVVEISGEPHPSVAISGDDLHRLVVDARRALALLYAGDGNSCAWMLDDVVGRLTDLRSDYETAMRIEGRMMPYVPGRDRF